MCKLLCVLFLTLSMILNTSCIELLVKQMANGTIKGIELTSSLGQKYYAFKGIPYAEPPITGIDPYTGQRVDRRFKAPVPLKSTWTDNLKVKDFGDFCIPSVNKNQTTLLPTHTMSEDCLFLNVYVPADGEANKTVLVFIHGGAHASGDASDMNYGPEFLLFEDNIVVTLQYRLGIFGFLNLGCDKFTGNMGLKDQQLALKWLYENIQLFSGNKSEILLFGESAGTAVSL